ncbi:hypothetical protein AURANDRAFT_66365 [Aureococcus anophagefferens]|uniref:Uncharacterized protein n=1 Tax=Aureococcus anophagefferens TaxID=44056 RepID=F0YHA1_AURAN|nr:hypothetical protein AURANDRAFT_66365 [Aureococcus anophagefferens]EGB05510.1 hypothetical protein AURANDRAFT_66365 [Aureococcus anophagefferens]|eukprot:XP_009039891.1 hypothetical protein AURANDRAFT_66365 [Aureococcus anophagefferens]
MTASTPSAHARVAPSSAERKSVRKSIQDTFEKGFTTSKDSVDIPHTMLDAIFDDLKQPNECISGAELRAVGFKLVDEFVSHLLRHINHGDPDRRMQLTREIIQLQTKVHRHRFQVDACVERGLADLERERVEHERAQLALLQAPEPVRDDEVVDGGCWGDDLGVWLCSGCSAHGRRRGERSAWL